MGLVQTELWGTLLDTTIIDLMWAKQAPYIILKENKKEDKHTYTHNCYTYSTSLALAYQLSTMVINRLC